MLAVGVGTGASRKAPLEQAVGDRVLLVQILPRQEIQALRILVVEAEAAVKLIPVVGQVAQALSS